MNRNISNKLIVLDMDGVVNSTTLIKEWIYNKLEEIGGDTEENKKKVKKIYLKEFCDYTELIMPELAERVTEICEKTDSYILWSSSWRMLPKYQNIENAKEMFIRRGLPGDRLIGYTPCFTIYDDGCRGSEINSWLNNNIYGTFKRVAVIDDRFDAGMFLPSYAKFFQTTTKHSHQA